MSKLANAAGIIILFSSLLALIYWIGSDRTPLSSLNTDAWGGRTEQELANSLSTARIPSAHSLSSTHVNVSEIECPQPPQRHVYYVNQIFWSWAHTLEVSAVTTLESGEQTVENLGQVKSEPFSFSGFQQWVNLNGTVIATCHKDSITTITNIYVDDCQHRFLATISEQMSPANSAVSLYTIQNTDGDIIAISTMSKNFGTEVDINDQASGKRLVTVSKGWGQVSDAWSATFRQGMPSTLANDPRVIVMLLAAASSSGSWGLGGFLAVLLNPIWLLLLCCCGCACATAFSRARETTEYMQIPAGGPFYGRGYTTGFGSTEYV